MIFDSTISIGNILTIASMLIGGLFFLWRMEARIIVMTSAQEMLTNRLAVIDREIKDLAKITIEIARQDERMTNQDIRVNTLALRLDDFISGFPRRTRKQHIQD